MPAPTFNTNRRADDYSDDFSAAALDAQRWVDTGAPDYSVSGGRLRADNIGVGGTDYARVTNLVTLPRASASGTELDLEIHFEATWTIVIDFGAAGQEFKAGIALTLGNGTTRRRLHVKDAHGAATPLARLEDEAGATLGSTLALPNTSTAQSFLRFTRDRNGQYKWYAKVLAGDAWTLLHTETPSTPEIILSEMFAQQVGAAGPTWKFNVSHDYVRRVVGTPAIGSTLDLCYAHGTVVDDAFLDILDRTKPSGLTLVVRQ